MKLCDIEKFIKTVELEQCYNWIGTIRIPLICQDLLSFLVSPQKKNQNEKIGSFEEAGKVETFRKLIVIAWQITAEILPYPPRCNFG